MTETRFSTEPWACCHCKQLFDQATTPPDIYRMHVSECLAAHIADLKAHGLVCHGDETYMSAKEIGGRLSPLPRAHWTERWGMPPPMPGRGLGS